MKVKSPIFLSVLLLLIFGTSFLLAQSPKNQTNLNFSGDLRLRFEKDYSVTGKEDRDRARYRFRFGLVARKGDHIEVGARLTSGNPNDQQSPHQTLGGDFSQKDFSMDKAYFKYKFKNGWFWFGKNSFPFWKQNEMFWDDDVTPEGGSVAFSPTDLVTITAGQYYIDHFNEGLFESTLTAAQISAKKKSDAVSFAGGAGIYLFKNKEGDTGGYNALNNMDQNIVVVSAQVKFNVTDNVPLTVGGDFMKNFEEPNITGFEDETTGFVAQIGVKPGKWTLAAYYANIQAFAVVPNFAQDDWWRFGSGHTNSSDLKGFELRVAYNLGNKMNLVARHYITEMIKGTDKANRFRLDFNVKY